VRQQHEVEFPRRTLDEIQLVARERIPEHRNPACSGQRFLEHFKALRRRLDLTQKQAGDVAARTREAGNEVRLYRVIVDGDHDDRGRSRYPAYGSEHKLACWRDYRDVA